MSTKTTEWPGEREAAVAALFVGTLRGAAMAQGLPLARADDLVDDVRATLRRLGLTVVRADALAGGGHRPAPGPRPPLPVGVGTGVRPPTRLSPYEPSDTGTAGAWAGRVVAGGLREHLAALLWRTPGEGRVREVALTDDNSVTVLSAVLLDGRTASVPLPDAYSVRQDGEDLLRAALRLLRDRVLEALAPDADEAARLAVAHAERTGDWSAVCDRVRRLRRAYLARQGDPGNETDAPTSGYARAVALVRGADYPTPEEVDVALGGESADGPEGNVWKMLESRGWSALARASQGLEGER